MPYQQSLTILAPVREGAEREGEELLAARGDGVANGSVLDFGPLDDVHFARLMLAPADTGRSGSRLPASLILLSDFDGSVDAYLDRLVPGAGAGIARVFATCAGYPGGEPNEREGRDSLRRHRVREA